MFIGMVVVTVRPRGNYMRNGNDVLNDLLEQCPCINNDDAALGKRIFLRFVREKYGYDSFEYKVANEYVNFPPISNGAWANGTGEDF